MSSNTSLKAGVPLSPAAGKGQWRQEPSASKFNTSSVIGVATDAQRRLALIVGLAVVAATLALVPFAHANWPNAPAFLATNQTAMIGICLITSALMYGHFELTRATVLLHLSAGYAYTAVVLTLQFLSFPGSLVEAERLFGGPKSTIWLWAFWHFGPAFSFLFYAWSERYRPGRIAVDYKRALLQCAVVLAVVVAGTAALVTVLHDALPVMDNKGKYSGNFAFLACTLLSQAMLVAALVLLWGSKRPRDVLHVWLSVVIVALLCDCAITILGGSRLTMGWYVGRLIATFAFFVLFVVYLHEIFKSYRRSIRTADFLESSNSALDLDIEQRISNEKKLREAERQKDEFLITVAHELRNPLAPMRNAAHLLAQENLDDKIIKKTSEMLARQVEHMTKMVDDLMDVSRVSRGLALLQAAVMDPRQAVLDAVEQASSLISERRHQLDVQLPPDPIFVYADHERLVQIVVNLINNSAKYTKPGGHIVLRLEGSGPQVLLTVTDDGVGMTPVMANRAFDLFSQAEVPSDLHGGLGIGLSLVKNLVELHHGHVYGSSKGLGLGSQFVVALPQVLVPRTTKEQGGLFVPACQGGTDAG